MPASENKIQSQVKDDFDRQLRSGSPAIKRPASDMGAQDREEHSRDVEMDEGFDSSYTAVNAETEAESPTDLKAKQLDTGIRHHGRDELGSEFPHTSNPGAIQQQTSSDNSGSSASNSLLPTPSDRSTIATSISSQTKSLKPDLPSIDDQVAQVTRLVQKEIEEGQKGYVVSSKWLHRVQARSSHPPEDQKIDKVATEGEIGPLDNSDIAIVMEDSGKLRDEAGDLYVPLRPGLNIGEEYQVLPEEAWDLILSWYGKVEGSPVITRYAHDLREGDGVPNVQYELNPPIFSFLKVPYEHSTKTQKEKDLPPVRMLASKKMPFMEWLKNAKELVKIDIDTKVRVWRILGGLKSTTASGMLTPAASRSASPAPGAEIVASAGDKMLLDVNTFASLQIGEHREQLDQQDQTANPKYNGKVSLGTLGLGRDDVIVLEEQKPGLSGDWPSEHVKISLTKGLKDKTKGLTPSGRSSPAPGMMTRGRQRRDGRPKGITGLSNLGNTCYMNSALQCIRSVEELTQYFLHDQWKKDLNPSNPLGHRGEVAKAYANLIKQIYEENTSSTNPSKFKATIGRYGSSFSGYQQQDSQEFLLFLLDGLQEDLNRIQKKPYIEKPDSTDEMVHDHHALKAFADKNWEIYKARNDSVITDLFAGMYKSTVTCPVCQKVSIIFDPFSNLTLQLPIENNWSKEVLYFPLHKRPYRIDIDIDKNSSIQGLKEFVSKRTRVNPDLLLLAESYKNKIYKIFDNTTVISEANIQNGDIIAVYELDSIPTNYNPNKAKKFSIFTLYRDSEDELVEANTPAADRLLVPVYNRLVKSPGARQAAKHFFGQPTYIIIDREDNRHYDGVLKKVLGNIAGMTTKDILDEESVFGTGVATPEDSDNVVMVDDASSSGSNLPKASSVKSEDGILDISMRGNSEPQGDDGHHSGKKMHTVLSPGAIIPPQLRNLFNMTVASTGEGIPTGWSQINEHNEYDSVRARIPKSSTRRAAHSKTPSTLANGDSESVTSEDELADIEHDEPGAESGDSGSESSVNALTQPAADSDTEFSDVREMFKDKGRSRRQNTYSRKSRRNIVKKNQQRRTPVQPTAQPQASGEGLIKPGEAIILDWNPEAYDALFGGSEDDGEDELRGAPTWKGVELLADEELTAKRAQRNSRKKNGVSLEDCLNEFGKSETLSENNAWYCPRCKEHRRANKMFELWKAPDILVMHLKRFSSNRNFRDKLEVKVDYPTEGLDLSTMVQDKEDGKSLIYDLVAVDNHYGGLGGGHYTAYAKNFINQGWYEYNDSHVSSRSDPRSVVTSAAYLLFYRRRSDHILGGPLLEQILEDTNSPEADSETQRGSRDPSPVAGEGRRLGGSSHNGSSSASGLGPAHLVGDGGLAQRRQIRDLTPEEESQPRSAGLMSNDDRLPDYTAEPSEDEEKMQLDDDNLDSYYPQPGPLNWNEPGWGFGKVQRRAAPSEDEDTFGHIEKVSSNDSTRVEGGLASPLGSLNGEDDLEASNDITFSEDIPHDEYGRNMRESAPAPDFIPTVGHEDEDAEDLPVVELKPADDGDFIVSEAKPHR